MPPGGRLLAFLLFCSQGVCHSKDRKEGGGKGKSRNFGWAFTPVVFPGMLQQFLIFKTRGWLCSGVSVGARDSFAASIASSAGGWLFFWGWTQGFAGVPFSRAHHPRGPFPSATPVQRQERTDQLLLSLPGLSSGSGSRYPKTWIATAISHAWLEVTAASYTFFLGGGEAMQG